MRWSKQEEFQLELLTGEYPWPMVVEMYNDWATTHGYCHRTSDAMANRANILGVDRRPQGQYITLGTISAILGIDREKPRRWVRWGKIRAKRYGTSPSPYYVSRRGLQDWAKREPAFFRPYPRDALVLLFDSPHLADWVYEHPPVVSRTRCRPVRCVETGEVFNTITEAAQRHYVATTRIQAIVNTHETAGGRRFVDVAPRYGVRVA